MKLCGIYLTPLTSGSGTLLTVRACKACLRAWSRCKSPRLRQLYEDAIVEARRIEGAAS